MATLAAIRTALKIRLSSITDLRVYEHLPDTLNVPGISVLYIGPVDGPYATLGGDAYDHFMLLMAVQRNSLEKAQASIDDYMSKSGTKSIQAAIEGDQTLGGVVDFALFNGWEEPGTYPSGDVEYFAARANVHVWHR